MPAASSDTELTLVVIEGLLPGASNATLLARDATGREWVYKPEQGERELWDFPHGSLARREVACYRVSEALGLGVVPETHMATGPYGPGSAQLFLDEDQTWDPRPDIVEGASDLWPVVILDLVANNADRKIGHLLREPGKTDIWAIDNGLTFHVHDKLRTVLWSFAGRSVPRQWVESLNEEALISALEGLLEEVEVEAAVHRLDRLRADPRHPDPPLDRPPLPWPVW
jgi:hypothetical protein